jgi:hypothetical protein
VIPPPYRVIFASEFDVNFLKSLVLRPDNYLIERGKPLPQALMAVVRELAGFLRAMLHRLQSSAADSSVQHLGRLVFALSAATYCGECGSRV